MRPQNEPAILCARFVVNLCGKWKVESIGLELRSDKLSQSIESRVLPQAIEQLPRFVVEKHELVDDLLVRIQELIGARSRSQSTVEGELGRPAQASHRPSPASIQPLTLQ